MKSIEFLSQITEAKAKWQETNRLYQKKLTLLSKRDQLEEQISEINKNFTQFSSLSPLIKELRNLDHELDDLEELSLQEVTQAKEALLKIIFDLNHQYAIDYHIQQKQLTAHMTRLDTLQTIHEALKQLHHFLEVIEYGRQRVKGFGLWRYFVGLSPNRIIEHHLSQGAVLIEEIMPILDNNNSIEPDPLKQLLQSLASFLQTFHLKLSQRWGFKHLDQLMITAKQPIDYYLIEIKQWHGQLKEEKIKKEKKVKEWIEDIFQESD